MGPEFFVFHGTQTFFLNIAYASGNVEYGRWVLLWSLGASKHICGQHSHDHSIFIIHKWLGHDVEGARTKTRPISMTEKLGFTKSPKQADKQ